MDALRPIRTNAEHAAALREVDGLIRKEPKAKSALFDRLEALTILIDAFERNHPDHRIESTVDPVAAIEFHLERLGKQARDLESILGCTRTRVWEILRRRRALTLPQIRALAAMGIPAERLIASYPLDSAAGEPRRVVRKKAAPRPLAAKSSARRAV